jgi:Cu(I)/Ag(I) efflux system membrane protein CusA/SilA
MLSTGLRSPLGVQVRGPDLESVERAAIAVEGALRAIASTRGAYAERFAGGLYLDVRHDRDRAARHGLLVEDVQQAVEAAIGGLQVTEVVEGRGRYPVVVRYERAAREDPEALAAVLVDLPAGGTVPLAAVADIAASAGPPMIQSEDGEIIAFVLVDPGTAPVADYVEEASARLSRPGLLPPGTRLTWVGQFRAYERARASLRTLVPLTLLLVVLLLYLARGSLAEVGIVLLAVPFSLVGAVWLLHALGYNLSVAVWVGLIALAGLDAETGMVMLLYLDIARRRRGALRRFAELKEAIVEGAAKRLRPKLMTVLTDVLGLLPLLWASGPGADLMKRLAAPMVGGLFTSFLLELLVYPAIYAAWRGRGLERD